MRRILIIIGILGGVVALAWIAGSLLPREHVATSRVTLSQPPDTVWAVVRDLGALKGTWSDLAEARRFVDSAGREVWDERVSGFEMRLIVEESTPPSRLVTRIDSAPDAVFGGRWVYEITPAGGGTTVSVTEDGWVGNPLFRLMSKLGGQHKSLDGYLTALAKHFGETVPVQHARDS
jgi:Polyketide cyclase / dehydrase and lipid transport